MTARREIEKVILAIRNLPEMHEVGFEVVPPNAPLELFEGRFLLSHGGRDFNVDGHLQFHWNPYPVLKLSGVVQSDWLWLEMPDEVNVSQPDIRLRAPASVAGVSHGESSTQITCRFHQPVQIGANRAVRRVRFHLPNFPCYIGAPVRYGGRRQPGRLLARITLTTGHWVINIDGLRNCGAVKDALRTHGGVGIGHVGAISRVDGARFKLDDVSDLLSALHCFCSFARGAWCGPILVMGDGVAKPALWTYWQTWRVTTWRDRMSWFPEFDVARVDEAFRGFMRKWRSRWRYPVRHAIHWAVESNIGAGGLEGGIVMACTALEMLGWVRLVEEHKVLTARAYNSKQTPFAEKFRRLLRECSVPTAVPADYRALLALQRRERLRDGPEVLAMLRNAIVHPKKVKRRLLRSTTRQARLEAKHLALSYIELTLLAWFGYHGVYERRRFEGWHGVEGLCRVPWATKPGST